MYSGLTIGRRQVIAVITAGARVASAAVDVGSERPSPLRSMERDDIFCFESWPTHAPAVRAAPPDLVQELESLTAWAIWYGAPTDAPERSAQPKRVSARKWSQIRYFVDALGAHMDPGLTLAVNWCAGKGHLARALAERFGLPVTCVELDAALCRVGAQEASPGNAAVTFEGLDALSKNAGFYTTLDCSSPLALTSISTLYLLAAFVNDIWTLMACIKFA